LVAIAAVSQKLLRHARGEGDIALAVLALEALALALIELFPNLDLGLLA
jgi:hypothetical protein